MRYDGLLRAIERANARFEAEIQGILRQYAKSDVDTTQQLVASLKPKRKTRKTLHWTQRPENRAKVVQQMQKATKAKHG